MALELHNFLLEGKRLVQVETQPHHIAGVLAKIRWVLENSNCDLCRACGQNGGVKGMARQLNLEEIEVISPSGRQIITLK
ncbi:hypothetical protein [Nostoc sp.]|uniref:hypothetical protein n=1 Tax=Nostoc sp. TaxID=1180 RepID=UPI002FFD1B5A